MASEMVDPDKLMDVIVVGGGPAGIGMGLVLRDLGVDRFGILERHELGASFRRWPKEMRFITPSFNANAFGMTDLNAVNTGTSPADLIGNGHLWGRDYAGYLGAVAAHYQLPFVSDCEVQAISRRPDGLFDLRTSQGPLFTRFLVMATGEFQFPNETPFPGAEFGLHTSRVESWMTLPPGPRVVIGGYESGLDAACALIARGESVTVLADRDTWTMGEDWDPSVIIAPRTRERLQKALATDRLRLRPGTRVERIERSGEDFIVGLAEGESVVTKLPPILATGFHSGTTRWPKLFAHTPQGHPRLTESDESVRMPGVFLVGPQVRHEKVVFCFIYKFRQRFAVVGAQIGRRLDLDLAPLEAYRAKGMYLDDLSCCLAKCDC